MRKALDVHAVRAAFRLSSPSLLPMVKLPAGMTTISGHTVAVFEGLAGLQAWLHGLPAMGGLRLGRWCRRRLQPRDGHPRQ
jgi:hypothetical protein